MNINQKLIYATLASNIGQQIKTILGLQTFLKDTRRIPVAVLTLHVSDLQLIASLYPRYPKK